MKSLKPPLFRTGDKCIDRAFRIAVDNVIRNIAPFKGGLLAQEQPVILAGEDYDTPWTRDAAINIWNGVGLFFPDEARNTLLSVLKQEDGKISISGQYWDSPIWSIGAWSYYLYTNDKSFLSLALEAVSNTIAYLEATEFDASLNLFRGPACYADGVSAYPDIYTSTGGSSDISDWPRANPRLISTPGYGLPMHALSTNCLYYQAYLLMSCMSNELRLVVALDSLDKSKALKDAINKHFWNPRTDSYRYLIDPFGGSEQQEGLGNCFALLFGIADEQRAEAIFHNQPITPHGIPCLWPTFARYESNDKMSFGRHSGTIWPHIQAFWACASAHYSKVDAFEFEMRNMAEKACQNGQFSELYHPLTGQIYGGIQEGLHPQGKSEEWRSCSRQTWSATGFINMILTGLLGIVFETDGIRFKPMVPKGFKKVEFYNLPYRDMILDIQIEDSGAQITECIVNECVLPSPYLHAGKKGRQKVVLKLCSERQF